MNQLGAHRVFLRIDPDNQASKKVAVHCNFKYEATLRDVDTNNRDELCDEEYWAIIKNRTG